MKTSRAFPAILATALCLLASAIPARGQEAAIKTNLLGWATTSPNLGLEFGTGRRATIQVFGLVNPWNFTDGRHAKCWVAEPEFRLWTCEKFDGHFFGIHALGGEYNIQGFRVPFNTLPRLEDGHHYEGWFVGGGITYGYQWPISKHWNFEASIGVGYAYSPHKTYGECRRKCGEPESKTHYVGPTKAALSFMYIF